MTILLYKHAASTGILAWNTVDVMYCLLYLNWCLAVGGTVERSYRLIKPVEKPTESSGRLGWNEKE